MIRKVLKYLTIYSLSCIFDNKNIVKMKWKRPNTITGPVAEGEKYFRRSQVEDKIWRQIEKNSHVLFLAPRRVGKSSIVKYMTKNCAYNFTCKYENIQSDKTKQEFYKRLCSMIEEGISAVSKTKIKLWGRISTIKIKTISVEGLNIEQTPTNYKNVFYEMLRALNQENEKIVLFLDEFPDVIWNINKTEGAEAAESLLDELRTLRQTDTFNNSITMVLLGSIGLNHVVKIISGRVDKVNDLHKEFLDALDLKQAEAFVDHLIDGATMKIDIDTKNYLLKKLGYYIPFYIQLIIELCDELLYEEDRLDLSKTDIDKIYKQLIAQHQHFEDWENRLSKYFPTQYSYLKDILTECSVNSKIDIQAVYNIAVRHDTIQNWKAAIDDILIADGYLSEKNGVYKFNSPLLRDWWKLRFPKVNN